ncbi:sugar phosphate isomerase/epimerase family protein [Novosphingobium malaysiense]|uniref:Xylose isomerase-like TIM barrel domain-containing protein n=1 Tax=Novosphingobium malaysiense TaxID=1348853 RepID=A0A0B1ZKD5_9SPHN|nr:TIM barrel protein [Novosphingobium malaysiense]KHK89799.1 hypothetical protein LK12_17900 [Novosphingobium malaysiense]
MSPRPRLSLDHLTVLDASPLEAIDLAVGEGIGHVSVIPALPGLPALRVPDILDDRDLHRCIAKACRDAGVTVHTLEGFVLTPETGLSEFDRLFAMAEAIDARSGVVVVSDPERTRAADLLGALCIRAARQGMRLNIEYVPVTCAPTMDDALALIDGAGAPENAGLVIDILHHVRSGGTMADIRQIDPARIGAAQICDGALAFDEQLYLETEMLFERLLPGEGEFPLREFLASLPGDVVVGIEAPMASRKVAGVSARERAAMAVAAARDVAGAIGPA